MPLDQEPEQVEGALEGGARVCGDEAEVRICEATLSRTEEECHPTVRGVRAGESVLGAEKTVALGTGLARERRLLITGEPPKRAEDRKKTESERLHRPSRTLTTSKTRAYSEFPKMNGQQQSVVSAGQGKFEYEILRSSPWSSKTTWPHSPRCGFRATSKP